MTVRILPPDEWRRIPGPHLPELLPFVRPQDMDIVVVEEDGEVVASLGVMKATHFEGLWVDPKHRNAGVCRALIRKATELTEGRDWAFGAVGSDHMKDVLNRLGGADTQLALYVLPLEAQ